MNVILPTQLGLEASIEFAIAELKRLREAITDEGVRHAKEIERLHDDLVEPSRQFAWATEQLRRGNHA